MFVQLAGSTGSVTKGSVQSFRAMAMPMMMMLEIRKNLGLAPEIVFSYGRSLTRRNARNRQVRGKKSPRATRLGIFSEPSVRE